MQSRRNFGERVLSIFLTKLWPPSLILMAAEGWREKEICTKGAIKGHLENIEYSKYQLIVVTAEEVLSKPFLLSLGFGRGSRVEGTKSRVEGNMSTVEGNMSRVLKNENKIIKIKIKK